LVAIRFAGHLDFSGARWSNTLLSFLLPSSSFKLFFFFWLLLRWITSVEEEKAPVDAVFWFFTVHWRRSDYRWESPTFMVSIFRLFWRDLFGILDLFWLVL
jgi:hypothetical protein